MAPAACASIRRSMARTIAGAVVAAMSLASCSAPAPSPQPGEVRLRFATDWRAEAEQGGFYEALADGEFSRRGLEVDIISGGPGVNVPQMLAAGAVDLGVGSNSFVAMNLAAQDLPVKAIAAFMQKDPQVLIAHRNSGIANLSDMRGRPIYLADASLGSFWPWLKRKVGFSDQQVRKYNFSNAPFLADRRVIEQGYLTSEPYTIARQGGDPLVFLLADAGYQGYAGMIFAPDRLIEANSKAIKGFVEAAAVGWRQYLWGDPSGADALIMKANPDMTEDVLAQARDKLRRYAIMGPSGGDLGGMSPQRWATFLAGAVSAGIYPASLDSRRAYDMRFLPTGVRSP